MCQFFCGLFKREKNYNAAMTMTKSPSMTPYPMTSEISPAIEIETDYSLEEKVALAMAFSKRLDQLSGDGSQVFANVTRSDSVSPNP